jgi:hypothetical protein
LTQKEIYVYISEEIFIERITASPDLYMNVDDFFRYTDLYEEYLQKTTLPIVRVRGDEPFYHQLKRLSKN